MTTYKNAEALSKLTLGKATSYASQYNAELLQAVPRSLNRDDLAINENALPFNGEDVWYGYELSWLNMKGKPVVAVAEFRFPCTSQNIVESKSFKLYLNSFNQTRFKSFDEVQNTLVNDLSKLTQTPVEVSLYKAEKNSTMVIEEPQAMCIDELDIEIENYNFDPTLLKNAQSTSTLVSENLVSHLLKSNCLITNQPDWASVYISYKGKAINHENLLRYLISFRQHNEFHEQCVERIFCDIQHYCDVEELTIYARYTRRGGLDINPYRTTTLMPAPTIRTVRQ
jgi:7-cyano-7-deazaguanine reductase